MYMHNEMVCKVATFSYNSGSTGVPVYHGSIVSIKDRCVVRTCARKKPAETVPSLDPHFSCVFLQGAPTEVNYEDQRSKYSKTAVCGPIYVVPGLVLFLKDFAHFTW